MCFGMSLCIMLAISAFLGTNLLFAQDRIWKGVVGPKESRESQHVKAAFEDDTAAVVKFSDRIVEPEDALSYSQQFHGFIQEFGEKYTTMVLSVPNARVELFQLTRSAIFLKAVANENEVREREELQPIKVYLHIPIKSLHDHNSLSEIQALAVGLVNYIGLDGTIAGVIFETSLIQTPIPAEGGAYSKEMNMAMVSTVVKFKKFLNSLQLTFGHELKMGLALNSYLECITCLVSDVGEVISSFDVVVLNMSFMEYKKPSSSQGNEEKDAAYFDNCVTIFQKKFQQLKYCHIGEIFDIKN